MSAKKCWCDAMILLFTSAIVSPFVERLNKPTGILNFKGPRERGENLYKELQRDKVRNIITIANCRFVYDQLQKKLPENFSDFFYFEHLTTSSQY